MIVVAGIAPGKGGTIERLATMLDVAPDDLTSSVVWLNLWPHGDSGSDPHRYVELIEQGTRPGDLVVMLGRMVAEAFRLGDLEPLGTVVRNAGAGPTILALPHPSGLNRWWNDPANETAAVETLRTLWNRAR